ncbi:hypothetical protein PQR53_29665 [Paraburkholderia fungorum]|uniref:hypothetical protein n=1 Tax=Paraburkholderia fungorum TaxID=134537 RepID=UPI0038BDC28D
MSRFLLPTFLCGRQRKVGAAPHRGNANNPITNQGKANAIKTQTNKRRAGKQAQQKPTAVGNQPTSAAQATISRKGRRHKSTDKQTAPQEKTFNYPY